MNKCFPRILYLFGSLGILEERAICIMSYHIYLLGKVP
jgi:hypothetical protein